MRLKELAPYAVFAGLFFSSVGDLTLGSPVGEAIYAKTRETLNQMSEKEKMTFYWGVRGRERTDKRAAQIGELIVATLSVYYAIKKRKTMKINAIIDDFQENYLKKDRERLEKKLESRNVLKS